MGTLHNGVLRDPLDAALDAWRSALGSQHVSTSADTLDAAATATFATTQRPRAVLRPANREEVQQCVRIAGQFAVPIYPVSTGKNWGYGSRVPSQDGAVIVDLGRLNRILGHDEKLGHVTLEPGVTMRQLFDYLAQRKSNLMMSVTGSSPDTSLIGNILERGVGFGLYGERFNHVCGLEVVLPTGACIHTGFGRFPTATATEVCRWGVGPSLDGLFSQSNLGIVTRLTLWLAPRPRHFQVFLCWLDDEARLPALVDALQTLRMEGTLQGTFALWNDYRTAAVVGQYPYEETASRTPLPAEVRQRLRRASRGACWNALGSIQTATWSQGRADRRRIKRVLRGKVDRLLFIDPHVARIARWLRRPYRWLTGLDLNFFLDAMYHHSIFLGYPTNVGLGIAYWRKKRPVPEERDPDRDRCGVIFCAPCVPFDGGHVRTVADLADRVLTAHGFEPIVSAICITERFVEVIVYILYDRETAGEDARAMACHDELLQQLSRAGYLPYRLGLQSMHLLPAAGDDSARLFEMLKGTLDPQRILSPGKYEQIRSSEF